MLVGKHKSPDLSNEEWDGAIDQLRIYGGALTDSDIMKLYNDGM